MRNPKNSPEPTNSGISISQRQCELPTKFWMSVQESKQQQSPKCTGGKLDSFIKAGVLLKN
ncbi:hypothetical protein QUB19_11320 [Microcoleus sp. B4-C5]|uniref:hypothetical protein n=1 Tax=unclassified Microcoleus TaxID=2642155 RepID=UPI002FD54C1F